MSRRWLIEFPLALALKRLVGPPAARRADQEPAAPPPAGPPAAPPERGRLALVALVLLVAGSGLVFVFDAWFARLAGVLALLAFIVAGVFAIATPALLEQDSDNQ